MDNSTTSADNEEYKWIPPRHIYALRDIIVENGVKNNNDALYDGQLFYDAREDDVTSAPATDAAHGDGSGELDVVDVVIVTSPRSESPPDDVTLSPPPTKGGESSSTTITKRTRLISSQMINISKEDNVKLIKMSRGAVLCSQWIDDDNNKEQHEEERQHEEDVRYEEEGEDESNVETAYNNNNLSTAVVSSPQQVRICTTANKDNIEEQVTVVPYSMARRRMGCNCRNNNTANDGEGTTTKRRVRALNAVCTICQSVKRSFFRQFKREHTTNNNSNNKLANEAVEEEYCKECNYFGDNSNPKPKKKSWLRRQRRQRRRRKRRMRNRSSLTARNAGMTIYGDEAVLGNTAAPSES